MAKNTVFNIISNGKDTIPLSVTKTGTIKSDELVVTGTGTLFLSEVKVGDWIFSPTLNEVQQVASILTDTNLALYKRFSTDISVALNLQVSQSIYAFLRVELTAAGKIDNVAIAAGKQFEWYSGSRSFKPLAPIAVDATGTVATFSATIE